MPYRILEHTADVGIEATAPDIHALFEEAVRATAAVVLDRRPPRRWEERAGVAVEADDVEALLADVLAEALWTFESTGKLPVAAALKVSSGSAEGSFFLVKDAVIEGPAIKAVTYHQLEVRATPSGWRARVYFDV